MLSPAERTAPLSVKRPFTVKVLLYRGIHPNTALKMSNHNAGCARQRDFPLQGQSMRQALGKLHVIQYFHARNLTAHCSVQSEQPNGQPKTPGLRQCLIFNPANKENEKGSAGLLPITPNRKQHKPCEHHSPAAKNRSSVEKDECCIPSLRLCNNHTVWLLVVVFPKLVQWSLFS